MDENHELATLLPLGDYLPSDDEDDLKNQPGSVWGDDHPTVAARSRTWARHQLSEGLRWSARWSPQTFRVISRRRFRLVTLMVILIILPLILLTSLPGSLADVEDDWEWYHSGALEQDWTKPQRMTTMNVLTGACLEAWVARGELCSPSEGLERMRRGMSRSKIDAVWTWVNGSDPRHAASSEFWTTQKPGSSLYEIDSSPAETSAVSAGISFKRNDVDTDSRAPRDKGSGGKWFRNHDELRYSIRSANMYIGEGLRTIHVLATDFRRPFISPSLSSVSQLCTAIPELMQDDVGFSDRVAAPDDLYGCGLRDGQWPQWMDPNLFFDEEGIEKTNAPNVKVQHHWNLFTPPDDATQSEEPGRWKHRILPTFNSYAIETQIMNLVDLHEIFIYNNDDFFFNKPFSVSDFYTPLYGQVFRFQPHWGPDAIEDDPSHASGETPQLRRSAWIISQRFGTRAASHGIVRRPYIEHTTKTYALPLLRETKLMFPDEFAVTSGHRFRGAGRDIVAVVLANHMTVERHREALLWSFFVGRGDRDGDGWVSVEELDALVAFLRGGRNSEDNERDLKVMMPRRTTLKDMSATLGRVGMKAPEKDTILYTSQDGYPYFRPLGESEGWPKVYGTASDVPMCTLDLGWCLPEYFDDMGDGIEADRLLKRFAFERPQCGDCAIVQLTGLSGPRGMSAFLPPHGLYFPITGSNWEGRDANTLNTAVTPTYQQRPPVAYLPIGSLWQSLNFSLSAVEAMTAWPTNRTRREFAMMLIQRYSYVTAVSPFHYVQLKTPESARRDLQSVTDRKKSLLCIQDDIIDPQDGDTIDDILKPWLENTFPQKLPFERQ